MNNFSNNITTIIITLSIKYVEKGIDEGVNRDGEFSAMVIRSTLLPRTSATD